MAVTYNDLTLDIRRSLRQAGIEAATLEARELVCFAAGKDKARLLRDGALYASPEVEEAAWALARRRLAGEPVAYLIGEWEFYGLPLDISESVLIPRPDTETLAEAAIGWLRQQEAPRVLDLCAGSGCLGLAIASQVKDARVVLGELSDGALRVCRQNIRRCGLTGRVTAMQLDAHRSSGWGTLTASSAIPPISPPGIFPGWTPPSGITSPTWPWTAGPTAWTFTGPSAPTGARCCIPGPGCASRWASARPTTCCG